MQRVELGLPSWLETLSYLGNLEHDSSKRAHVTHLIRDGFRCCVTARGMKQQHYNMVSIELVCLYISRGNYQNAVSWAIVQALTGLISRTVVSVKAYCFIPFLASQ